ncbi:MULTISPECIES: DUF1176 domain-containing protein [Acinetobacter]|uniref:DUF1176 domain-containing protein n=1 Tax=Acinetobacter baylyi (strain ATCC 33305 / BD413 / ADP1) TaxID=62977 RepID=Q6FDZ1_ACIAD|nr:MULTISPECIES: DUF1176 domain-containing protein [Acinetobacter]ENV55691.1 hypothetical protein F952_00313 [Acinetobacter baylyi DSM 14961 = CIP 107474]KAF2371434.1 hypothetical protein BSL88_05845 [Acinetobacter baylyi]KAF2373539.1 hypothetical protein BSL67_11360 [Acinetobacter baylyi]KAF2376614.1 hypothetical protein BSN81_11980 [Acinetobacter baylyi]KAF2381365.1 hypothetical protein BSN83_06340 [Acinetobacter baylyi]
MIHLKKIVSGCGLMAISCFAFAQEIKGLSFYHQDWEVYCSNTGTCRAAGYQSDDGSQQPASILLTREAGSKQPVQAEFALAGDDQETFAANKIKNIRFYVNGKDLGTVSVKGVDSPLMGKLSTAQVNGLLQQATQKVDIVFKNNHYVWKISDSGMTAALLKVDDFQKRIGTVGALVKKGKSDDSKVLMPQPKLVIKKVKTADQPYLTLNPKNKQYASLYKLLMAAQPTPKEDGFCEGVYDFDSDAITAQSIELYKLTNNKVLATTLCWRGAYNEGYGAWVLNQSLTGPATYITQSASDIASGIISSAQKGRGIGDCWMSQSWIWNGQKYVQNQDMWTGMCKGLAAGGVWELDQIEAVVK